MPTDQATVQQIFARGGGTMRAGEALAAGIHSRTLTALRDAGALTQLSRGVYRWAALPMIDDPDLVVVAKRIPKAVVCLISALAMHGLTTQIPHVVHLALPRTARRPVLDHPPIEVHRFSTAIFAAGITTVEHSGTPIRVYGPEKTLADCFRFRNHVGLDVVVEALRAYRSRRGASLQRVLEFARICRVEAGMRPYLEATA